MALTPPPVRTKAHYFYGTRLLATSEFEAPNNWPKSQLYLCGECGETWARVLIEGAIFEFNRVPCPKHKATGARDWSAIPGSILPSSLTKALTSVMDWAVVFEHLPPEVVVKELEAFLGYVQRKDQS